MAASRSDSGDIGVGSVFDLAVRMGRRRTRLQYQVKELAGGKVTFAARSPVLESVDTETVARGREVTEVTYDSHIRFRRPFRIADPLLAVGLSAVAERALHGLEQRLSEAA